MTIVSVATTSTEHCRSVRRWLHCSTQCHNRRHCLERFVSLRFCRKCFANYIQLSLDTSYHCVGLVGEVPLVLNCNSLQ